MKKLVLILTITLTAIAANAETDIIRNDQQVIAEANSALDFYQKLRNISLSGHGTLTSTDPKYENMISIDDAAHDYVYGLSDKDQKIRDEEKKHTVKTNIGCRLELVNGEGTITYYNRQEWNLKPIVRKAKLYLENEKGDLPTSPAQISVRIAIQYPHDPSSYSELAQAFFGDDMRIAEWYKGDWQQKSTQH